MCCLLPTYFWGVSNEYPPPDSYTYPDEILPRIEALCYEYPDICNWEIIGNSTNTKEAIYALSVGRVRDGSVPSILVIGQHQSEEPLGIEVGFFIMEKLAKNAAQPNSLALKSLWYFVPTLNPEGNKIFFSGQNQLQRKNTSTYATHGQRGDGVDLNKNYPYNWEKDYHYRPLSPYYKGVAPASEKETQSAMYLMRRENFSLAFFLHTSLTGAFSETIFFPWNHQGQLSADYYELKSLAATLASHLPCDYQTGNYKVHTDYTSRRGIARDYVYQAHGTYAFTIENGGIYEQTSIVIPPVSQVDIINQKNLNAISACAKEFLATRQRFRLCYPDNTAISYQEFIAYPPDRENPSTQTNKAGYAFINRQTSKIKIHRQEYSIKDATCLNIAIPHPPTIDQLPAIVYIGNSFQDNYRKSVSEISISNQLVTHSYQNMGTGEFNPWLDIEAIPRGILRHYYLGAEAPHTTEQAYALIDKKNEKLSFVDKLGTDLFIVYPHTALGIEFRTISQANKKYYISHVSIYVQQKQPHTPVCLNIVDANKNKQIASYQINISEGQNIIDTEPQRPVVCSAIRIEIANQSLLPFAVYREAGGKRANMNVVHYNSWQKENGNDFAIEISLKEVSIKN